MTGTDEQRNPQRRYLIYWLVLAVLALTILGGVLVRKDRSTLLRWSVFLSTDAARGQTVFHQKGCIHCHSVDGVGGKIGPDLGGLNGGPSGLAFLVTAMWNHAPNMWAYMRAERFPYPKLSYEETAQLVAYLYMAGRLDGAGDAQRGRLLFTSHGCVRCHRAGGTEKGGPGSPGSNWTAAARTPMAWAEAMWNSAPVMETAMRKAGTPWPKLSGSNLNDLFAYARQEAGAGLAAEQFDGDPEKGWQAFQSKGCIDCHSVQGEGPSSPKNWPSRTFLQVAESMWNGAPGMSQAMQARGMAPPRFTGAEMMDLAAFVFALRYFDPPGTAIVGRSVFRWRRCSHCHGAQAQGTALAPALRGLGRNYNSISLATALWSHGRNMFQRNQQLGLGWPTLQPGDVGDLLAFLNSPLGQHPQN